ncbi:MAG TPA: SRPBCC family protein [Candidatus Paceibacterota bacterium]
MNQKITVETKVKAPIEKVWAFWTEAKHIEKWNNASPDWHTPRAINNLKIGGRFTSRMEAKDGSAGFDFGGTYTTIEQFSKIEYRMDDGRMARIDFIDEEDGVAIVETFDPEKVNPAEMQKAGWQAILDNFKSYAESNGGGMKVVLKSAGAVFAGFVTVALLSTVTDMALEKVGVFPAPGEGLFITWMLALALAYRCVYTVLGGYVTARPSSQHARHNVVILASIGTVAGIAGVFYGWNLSQHWYPIAIAVTAFPLTWLGGWIRE